MEIIKPKAEFLDQTALRRDLSAFLARPLQPVERPCIACHLNCPECGSQDCVHRCSVDCSNAAANLSIDPQRYPVENHVVPLVYELAAQGVYQPCWSCEGHTNPQGGLWKLPQVSFYTPIAIYAQILNQHLIDLSLSKSLSAPWQIKLTAFGNPAHLTYTLCPDLSGVNDARLGGLQHDLHTIAEDISARLRVVAQRLIDSI